MLRRSLSLAAAAAAIAVAGAGHAAALNCQGKLSLIGMTGNWVTVRITGYGAWHVCNVELASPPEPAAHTPNPACRGWYAAMLGAKLADQDVSITFDIGTTGYLCTGIGNGSILPSPLYVTGIYVTP